jgi:catechol 2,3-dioxygenase-like lactoylglutathione lyase family enzyme
MLNILTTFSGFSVDNLQAAREFYSGKLGLKPSDDKMGLRYKLPGGSSVFIYEKPDHQAATFTVLNFEVKNIDKAVDDLLAKDIEIERYGLGNGIKQDDKGILRGLSAGMGPDIAWFKDPAGNILAVLQIK